MLVRELRAKSREELMTLLNDLKAELFLLRFRNSTNQLKEVHKIELVRKDIARVFTVLNSSEVAKPAINKKVAPAKKHVVASAIPARRAKAKKAATPKETK